MSWFTCEADSPWFPDDSAHGVSHGYICSLRRGHTGFHYHRFTGSAWDDAGWVWFELSEYQRLGRIEKHLGLEYERQPGKAAP